MDMDIFVCRIEIVSGSKYNANLRKTEPLKKKKTVQERAVVFLLEAKSVFGISRMTQKIDLRRRKSYVSHPIYGVSVVPFR